MSWLVVHSKPREEERAAQHLANQGFEVFLPRLRQRKRRAGGWRVVTGPLFPRYLFARVEVGEQDTSVIRSTQGVANLVRFGYRLAEMPGDVIDYLRAQQDPMLQARAEDEWPHKPGDRVSILEGPFAGLTGVYQMPKDEQRVLLLVELLGRQNQVLVERDAVA
ncbi:MAG: transcription/translation regulatory transformer protein RfaH [Haliea sp.]|nr:transcription/translation regulatory transformer protein RfaH [Haliea sp.]|tara:strand:- start:2261 stop:2752 length:492 start_codon:yes stop_codon:yes gene_type:complete